MSGVALGLILVAAVFHATWNMMAKRAGGGAAFQWVFSAVAVVIYGPLAVVVLIVERPALGPMEFAFIGASGLLHLFYFGLLQRAYREGDMSLVYPLARGVGPLLSVVAAIGLLGERPSYVAVAGGMLVILSVFVLTSVGAGGRRITAGLAVVYGLLTGVCIACYTLTDKYAVSVLVVPPLLLDYGSGVIRTAALSPYALRHWETVKREWSVHRTEALTIGGLGPLAYILVLTAMKFTPVSYVAPAREVSILIGAVLGTKLLGEGHAAWRLTAAAGMVAGVVALAVG